MNAENELEHATSIRMGSEQLRWKWFSAGISADTMVVGRRPYPQAETETGVAGFNWRETH